MKLQNKKPIKLFLLAHVLYPICYEKLVVVNVHNLWLEAEPSQGQDEIARTLTLSRAINRWLN